MKEAVMLINIVPITLLGQRKDKVFVYIFLHLIHILSYSSISQGSSRKKCLGMISGVQPLALGLSYFHCIYLSFTDLFFSLPSIG